MKGLKQFFDDERKRVFEPGPYFTERVMARLAEAGRQEAGIWELVPRSTRSVFAVALMLMLCFVFVEVFVPQMPQIGLIESYLATDDDPSDSFLHTDAEVPSEQEIFVQIIGLEEDGQ